MGTTADILGQVKTWQEIFGGGPLAAFLGVMLSACIAFLGLYIRSNQALLREKDSHAETIRTTTALAAAMERTWAEQLRTASAATEAARSAVDLQNRALAVLDRSVTLAEQRKARP